MGRGKLGRVVSHSMLLTLTQESGAHNPLTPAAFSLLPVIKVFWPPLSATMVTCAGHRNQVSRFATLGWLRWQQSYHRNSGIVSGLRHKSWMTCPSPDSRLWLCPWLAMLTVNLLRQKRLEPLCHNGQVLTVMTQLVLVCTMEYLGAPDYVPVIFWVATL